MESRRHPVPVAIAVGLLLLVVALASRPDTGQLQPDVGGQPASVALDTLFYLFIVASLAGLLILGWALWPHPEIDMAGPPRSRWPLLLAILAACTVVSLVWWRAGTGSFPAFPFTEPGGGAGGTLNALRHGPPSSRGPDWIALLITAAVVVAATLFAWRQLRPARRPPMRGRPLGEALEAVLDDALDDVIGEQDPRKAVIAAWARTERLLAAGGLPRQPAEAPFEYATRAAAQLGLGPGSLDGFAWLFEWARFSVNEVSPKMREEALARLRAVREGLRLAA